MTKRKREAITAAVNSGNDKLTVSKIAKTNGHVDVKIKSSAVVQIVTGSYERVLHGIAASISNLSSDSDPKTTPSVQFADSFLFNAHASAVRCLALSPPPDPNSSDSQGVFLATGGSDEKINVYSLAASPVPEHGKVPAMPSLGNNVISENPGNRELGTLLQHSSNITALHFPTRSKLLSGSEDNTIAVTRLKDLTVVSMIKAPRPKAQGQPSGDTAPPGFTPAGINDFAVHPSLKLMVSIGRGERCMRLWNLVTGKKAGVLNFSRDVLQSVRESKYSSGEGRRIRWSPDGSEFAVAFERGVVVFGEDSRPKCKVLPQPLTKIHQICYLSLPGDGARAESHLLALSTEDGRILLFGTRKPSPTTTNGATKDPSPIADGVLHAQIGGKAAGFTSRIKDFDLLTLPNGGIAIVTASSNGTVRVIHLPTPRLLEALKDNKPLEVGEVIGSYETGNRLTCLKAFVMLPAKEDDQDPSEVNDDFAGFDDHDASDSESDDDDT